MYTVVIEETVEDLIEKVNVLQEKGWNVEGGVAVTVDSWFAQAMSRSTLLVERSKEGLPPAKLT